MKKLKTVLLVNSTFSLISGLTMIFIPDKLSSFIGVESKIIFSIIGFGLIVFGLMTLWVAMKRIDSKMHVKIISISDFTWVLASVYVILINPFSVTPQGLILISSTATLVLIFGFLQIRNNRA